MLLSIFPQCNQVTFEQNNVQFSVICFSVCQTSLPNVSISIILRTVSNQRQAELIWTAFSLYEIRDV